MPETAYDKFLEESKEYARQWNAMNNAAEEFMKKEKIPEKIAASMCFSQASLVSLKNDNSDLEMIISKDSLWEDGDDSQYRKITFKKAEVLEKEEGIDDSSTNPMLLDEEIHISDKGFVFYMTFETAKGFAYFTVECQDVQFTNCDML